jgi:threonine/homoserine/homoserine lactone efflux protein
MKNEKTHSTLLALVGGYVLFLAYQIWDNYRNGAGEMPDYMYIIVIILLALGGLGAIYYAWMVWRKAVSAEKAGQEESAGTEEPVDPPDDH